MNECTNISMYVCRLREHAYIDRLYIFGQLISYLIATSDQLTLELSHILDFLRYFFSHSSAALPSTTGTRALVYVCVEYFPDLVEFFISFSICRLFYLPLHC